MSGLGVTCPDFSEAARAGWHRCARDINSFLFVPTNSMCYDSSFFWPQIVCNSMCSLSINFWYLLVGACVVQDFWLKCVLFELNMLFSTFLSDGGVLNQTEETEDSQQGEVGKVYNAGKEVRYF